MLDFRALLKIQSILRPALLGSTRSSKIRSFSSQKSARAAYPRRWWLDDDARFCFSYCAPDEEVADEDEEVSEEEEPAEDEEVSDEEETDERRMVARGRGQRGNGEEDEEEEEDEVTERRVRRVTKRPIPRRPERPI